ncbi:MAG TPA: hypothetical protein VGM63_05610 [Mucilaginibacter sp.]|jgi:hypothetical protein
MKTILLMIIATALMMSCKKSGTVNPEFFGKWELRRTYGGFGGYDSAFVAGNGTAFQFNSDSTYKHFTKNKLDAQGAYHIKIYNNPTQNTIANKMLFLGNDTLGTPIYPTTAKLTIGTTAADGLASDYVKIQN